MYKDYLEYLWAIAKRKIAEKILEDIDALDLNERKNNFSGQTKGNFVTEKSWSQCGLAEWKKEKKPSVKLFAD